LLEKSVWVVTSDSCPQRFNSARFLCLDAILTGLLAEITEEWETGKIYLTMASLNPQAN